MVVGYCSVFVYIHIHMYVRGYEPRQANAVLIIKEGRGEGKSRVFYKQRGLWWSCSEFLLFFDGGCEEISPAAEVAARFAGELYGCEQHLALGFLGRMLS